jgi:hypothetical protein
MKRTGLLLTFIFLSAAAVFTLNLSVHTKQGINYKWHTVRVPLYLKLLDFFDRHYNYLQLTRTVTNGAQSGEEKALRLLRWTYVNIRRNPPELPVIDDHVWHIIIRGYGKDDQNCDVFTTLCNYAGLRAFYLNIRATGQTRMIPLAFVEIAQKWHAFDPYRGVYFKDPQGGLADIEDLRRGKWQAAADGISLPEINYAAYFKNLPENLNMGLRRANIQSPLNRIRYSLQQLLPQN